MEITLWDILLGAVLFIWVMVMAIPWMGILDKAGREVVFPVSSNGGFRQAKALFVWFRTAGFSRFISILSICIFFFGVVFCFLNLSLPIKAIIVFVLYWFYLSVFTLSVIRMACAFKVNWYWGLISAIPVFVPVSLFEILVSKEKYVNPLEHPEVLKEPKLYLVCSVLLSFVSMVGMTLLYFAWQARDMPIN